MSRYKVNYKGMSISINVINNMYVTSDYETEQLLGLDVVVNKKNGNTIYLGNFYVKMPKSVNQDEIELLSKYLIDNIDSDSVFDEHIKVAIHIQKTEPIPPTYNANITPDNEPTPILDANEMHSVWNGDTPSSVSFVIKLLNISLGLKWIPFNFIVK